MYRTYVHAREITSNYKSNDLDFLSRSENIDPHFFLPHIFAVAFYSRGLICPFHASLVDREHCVMALGCSATPIGLQFVARAGSYLRFGA